VVVYLLSEVTFNGSEIKTKSLQNSVSSILSTGILIDQIFIRLPNIPIAPNNMEEYKNKIVNKLSENCIFFISTSNIELIPYWRSEEQFEYNRIVSNIVSFI
jgi:CTP synthase (UTP-ammonia lyase)